MGRILVVDGTKAERRNIRQILKAEGHSVAQADSERAGEEKSHFEKFDLIVTDRLIFLLILRRSDYESRNSPAILLTSASQDKVERYFEESGIVGFVSKDGDMRSNIVEEVNRVLSET